MRPRRTDRHLPKCVYFRHGAYWLVKRGDWKRLGEHWPGDARNEYDRLTGGAGVGLAKWIDEALAAHRKGGKVKDSTMKLYVTAGEKMKAAFADFSDPGQVKQKDIAVWRRDMADIPNMANRCLTTARIVFAYLVEQEIVDSNPAIGVKPFTEEPRERLLSADEFGAIREKAVPRLQLMMDLMLLTGQRLMDVVTIHESQIGAEGIYFKQGKTGNRLTVRWTPELRVAIEAARALNKIRSLTLFRGRLGSPPKYKSVWRQWRDACAAAGIVDAQARDVRAMSATEADAQGKSATRLLGHTSEAMTKRYLRGRVVPIVDGPSIGQVLDVGQTDATKQ